jgi:S1-C subfamily serine protease
MKIRSLLIAGLLVAGFVYMTSVAKWNSRGLWPGGSAAGPLWSGPEKARSAGLSTDEVNNIEIYKAANQATVNISTVVYQERWFVGVVPVEGAGSGFLLDADGRILTNNHVVQGRNPQISVILSDRSRYEASIVFREPENDLALLKITPKKKLQFLKLGDSDNLQVGQKVLAIGNPFGLDGTLTTGIISSLHRSVPSEEGRDMADMVQTDAAINPGNSGGPLLDSQGNVIGINTMIVGAANVGIGFALPINRAKAMLDDYQFEGRYGRTTLGVNSSQVLPVSGQMAEALELPAEGGLLVVSVDRNSPAAQAGIRGARQRVAVGGYIIPFGGDLIMAIDGRSADAATALDRATRGKKPGDTVVLTIYRDGRTLKVSVKLGQADQPL